jgi:transcriptional regulator GlxA family with amidase domain
LTLGVVPAYVSRTRLVRAASTLRATSLGCQASRSTPGSANQFSFSKAFKHALGLSPSVNSGQPESIQGSAQASEAQVIAR